MVSMGSVWSEYTDSVEYWGSPWSILVYVSNAILLALVLFLVFRLLPRSGCPKGCTKYHSCREACVAYGGACCEYTELDTHA
jgi:hypothetical protein